VTTSDLAGQLGRIAEALGWAVEHLHALAREVEARGVAAGPADAAPKVGTANPGIVGSDLPPSGPPMRPRAED
jgi:hypothetical protein